MPHHSPSNKWQYSILLGSPDPTRAWSSFERPLELCAAAGDIKSVITTITDIDDADQVPHSHKQLVLDLTLNDDDAPGTRREQLLRLVEEHYIRPEYGSHVSIDIFAMMGICTDDKSEIVEEIEFSD